MFLIDSIYFIKHNHIKIRTESFELSFIRIDTDCAAKTFNIL